MSKHHGKGETHSYIPDPPLLYEFASPFVMPISSTMLRYDCSSLEQQALSKISTFLWAGMG